MKYNISKELFEAVDGRKITDLTCGPTTFEVGMEWKWSEVISYNDFFFQCKEWVINEGYVLSSATTPYDGVCEYYTKEGHEAEQYIGYIFAISEQQAVFDACQWILDIKESELTNNEDFVTKLSGALFQIANLRIKDK